VVDLGGRPLLEWTIAAARGAPEIDEVVVSSDDPAIRQVASRCGATVAAREPALAADDVHAIEVVLDLLEREEVNADLIVMLLPTSPFRTSQQISEAIALHRRIDPPSVVSVAEAAKQLIHLRRMDREGRLEPFLPWDQLTRQRQDVEPLFELNGSIYVAKASVLLRERTFHVAGSVGYRMSRESSLDINGPADLAQARAALVRGEADG
jgi:CMP-N,N'-diacetyllegionaminic acid synthase